MTFYTLPMLGVALFVAKSNYETFCIYRKHHVKTHVMNANCRMMDISMYCKHMLSDIHFGPDEGVRKKLSERFYSLHRKRDDCANKIHELLSETPTSILPIPSFRGWAAAKAKANAYNALKQQHKELTDEIASSIFRGSTHWHQLPPLTGGEVAASTLEQIGDLPTQISCETTRYFAQPKEYVERLYGELIKTLTWDQLRKLDDHIRYLSAEAVERWSELAIVRQEKFLQGIALLHRGFVGTFDLSLSCLISAHCLAKTPTTIKVLLTAGKYFGGMSLLGAFGMTLALHLFNKNFDHEHSKVLLLYKIQTSMERLIHQLSQRFIDEQMRAGTRELNRQGRILNEHDKMLEERGRKLAAQKMELEDLQQRSQNKETVLQALSTESQAQHTRIESQQTIFELQQTIFESQQTKLESQQTKLESQQTKLASQQTKLESHKTKFELQQAELETQQIELASQELQLQTLATKMKSFEANFEALKHLLPQAAV